MRETLACVGADWARNRRNPKAQLILTAFRLAHACARRRRARRLWWWIGIPYLIVYRIGVEWILGVELPADTIVGPGLVIYHGQALVVNDHAIIGANVILRHCTTIGNKILPDGTQGPSPVIEDDVEVGANVVILGGIRIGKGAVIGAGAVVIKDVPAYAVVVGNPARVIRSNAAPKDSSRP